MKLKKTIWGALALLLCASCAKEVANDYDTFEDLSIKAWIAQNRPELKDNYQSWEGRGYYLDIHNAGDLAAKPLNDSACWVPSPNTRTMYLIICIAVRPTIRSWRARAWRC